MVNLRAVTVAGVTLALFAVFGTGLVAFTQMQTKDLIAANQRLALLSKLQALVPPELIDNDMLLDSTVVHRSDLLGAHDTTIYRGRRAGEPVAAVLTSVVPNGYAGAIYLLVAVRADGTLMGVRVVSHKETPGLGDKIEEGKSDWILGFTGKSLVNPPESQWKVKRDGGVFDQFTGATITPRSLVLAVKNTLLYVHEQGDRLYRTTARADESQEKE